MQAYLLKVLFHRVLACLCASLFPDKRPGATVQVFRVSVHTILVRLVPVRSVVVLTPAIPWLICPQAFLIESVDLTSLEEQRGRRTKCLHRLVSRGWGDRARPLREWLHEPP